MSPTQLRVLSLDSAHDRAVFSSGSQSLDRYLREQVNQDIRRRVAACFVALADEQRIADYYTLAAASLLLTDLPVSITKKLPRYPTVTAVRMRHLAVDFTYKGHELGGALLADALDRAARSEIAAYALMVDAINDTAVAFYKHHGFIALADCPMALFLPFATAFPARKIGSNTGQ